jgi:sugar phosphate isomerase/epimerase
MIRPAVITDEISQDFERSLDVMQEFGVSDAELRGLWGMNVMGLSPEQLARAREALEVRGMQVCAIASPIYKCNLFEGEAETGPLHLASASTFGDQLRLLERAIELCRYFNTKLIRVFSFWRQRAVSAEVLDQIAAAIRPGVARAEQAGVTLGLENEHACLLGTGRETAELLERIGSPALKAVWDPGNAFFAGELPFPDGYEAIRTHLTHVHVKDAVRRDGEPHWAVVGQGEIDYRRQFAALVRDGYDGAVSLETHYKPASGDAEEGSRECLAAMLALLDRASAA